jgi:hypothetical protein
MADYPRWVLEHKKKGTYVNFQNGKYYLYAAHSERIPGTDKVNRVSDGYIGRITEEKGLILARDKVNGDVVVYEYGFCMSVLPLCKDMAKGLRREHRSAADFVFVSGLMSALYSSCCPETYLWSYLSVEYPGLDMSKAPTEKQQTAIGRCARMVSDTMQKRFGSGLHEAATRLSRIHAVNINNKFYRSKVGEGTEAWLLENQIALQEGQKWQK